MTRWHTSAPVRLGLALVGSSIASCALYIFGVLYNQDGPFWYLIYNLFLAWVALVVSVWLAHVLRRRLWSSWPALAVTVLWLVFLPNTFYMMSDFIHLQDYMHADIVYDIVLFSSFILNAFILGLISLYLVHQRLRERFRPRNSALMLMFILLVTSFAIYIGRDLRWSTWDVILNPASILLDVSDRLLHPFSQPQMVTTTFGFLVLIGSVYSVVWFALDAAKVHKTTS